MNLGFEGKVAVVTGGTRGIGRAIARLLAREGAAVIATGTKRNAVETRQAEDDLGIRYVVADFSSESSAHEFREHLAAEPRIDVLINNAGINRIRPIEETTDTDYDDLHAVNVRAPYVLCRDLVPRMKQNGYGRIVNISSIWSVVTKPGRSLYSMNKHALIGLTATVAVECAADNVLVNAVSPGFTATELTASTLSVEERERLTALVPARRLAEPDEIATVVAFLASARNTYLTGQNIVVDGGFVNV